MGGVRVLRARWHHCGRIERMIGQSVVWWTGGAIRGKVALLTTVSLNLFFDDLK
jgi:hypothetical protein